MKHVVRTSRPIMVSRRILPAGSNTTVTPARSSIQQGKKKKGKESVRVQSKVTFFFFFKINVYFFFNITSTNYILNDTAFSKYMIKIFINAKHTMGKSTIYQQCVCVCVYNRFGQVWKFSANQIVANRLENRLRSNDREYFVRPITLTDVRPRPSVPSDASVRNRPQFV